MVLGGVEEGGRCSMLGCTRGSREAEETLSSQDAPSFDSPLSAHLPTSLSAVCDLLA